MATSVQNKLGGVESRLLFIDNIRWTLIVLVICHHSAVTYSHVGGWYYMDGPPPGMNATILFATFETSIKPTSWAYCF